MLTGCLVFGWFALLPGEYAKLGVHAAYAVGFVLNVVFHREAGYFDTASEMKPLLHLWSLCIEEQFYLLWPLLLFLTWRLRRYLYIVILAAIVLSFYSNVAVVSVNQSAAFFLAQNRFWELLVGGLLAYFRTVPLRPGIPPPVSSDDGRFPGWVASAGSAIGLTLLFGSFAVITSNSAFPGFWAVLPTTGTFLIIWSGPNAWINRNVLNRNFLVWIGLFSYPLYLWHWSLISFNSIVQNGHPSDRSTLAVVGASFLIAWFSNRFVERPIRFAKHEKVAPWVIPVALSATLGMVALVGVQIKVQNGYAGRFRPTYQIQPVNNPSVAANLPQRSPELSAKVAPPAPPAVAPIREAPDYLKVPEVKLASKIERPNRPFVQDIANYDPGSSLAQMGAGGDCFKAPVVTATTFGTTCVDKEPSDGPLVMLWGDSNTASLLAGLRALQKRSPFRIAQFNASSCPPVLGYDPGVGVPNCKTVNDTVFASLPAIGPDIILLSVQSYNYDLTSLTMMKNTLDAIRQSEPKGKRIILVGRSPIYPVGLPTYVARQFMGIPDLEIPKRARLEKNEAANREYDEAFSKFADTNGVEFISILDILCNPDGCVIRVPYDETHDDLVQFDIHHLTAAGSRFVVDAFAPVLLKQR